MTYIVEQILPLISEKNPLHGKKLVKVLSSMDEEYHATAEDFYRKYFDILAKKGLSKEYAIDCYLRMCSDMLYEQIRFMETGVYSNTSFAEVNKNVYDNPEIMEYHMNGLLMTQFLWRHHYHVFDFFKKEFNKYSPSIKSYLEIGGGHGLYTSEVLKKVSSQTTVDIVDISESSLNLSKQFVSADRVNYFLQDIYTYFPAKQYDFITMGEVLEHVEDPLSLLLKLKSLLHDNGFAFITTPANAPTIDHIYLFRNAGEIRALIHDAGMVIEKEYSTYVEDVDQEFAELHKVPLMFSAVIKKNK